MTTSDLTSKQDYHIAQNCEAALKIRTEWITEQDSTKNINTNPISMNYSKCPVLNQFKFQYPIQLGQPLMNKFQ